jgi:site-specific recombinase XerD
LPGTDVPEYVSVAPGRRGQRRQDGPTYVEAVQWFAAAHLRGKAGRTRWEQAGKHDVQQWMVWLLERYSAAYASNQFRALQQFFKWLAAEEKIGDPMAGLRPPHVPDRPVPVFAAADLARLERACAGRSFQQRRDAAVIGDRDPAVRARGHPP